MAFPFLVALSALLGCTREETHDDIMIIEHVLNDIDTIVEKSSRPQAVLVK